MKKLYDLEKGNVHDVPSPSPDLSVVNPETLSVPGKFATWNSKIESFAGLEARGIERVLPSERQKASTSAYLQMALLWFSTNVTANNLTLGLLGPLVYELSFLDSALCAVFGSFVGSIGASYMSIWGPQSGNRTMIVARYFMGYHPSKLCCLLNIVILLGYGMIDCVIGGQILSAVGNGSISTAVGIVIVAVISWIVAVFGMSVFHFYERWAFIPQTLVLFILIGSAAPNFDTTFPSTGSPQTIAGNRLSFFSLCLSASISWAPAAADFYVYYPVTTSRPLTFTLTLLGFTLSFSLVTLIGVGLASGTLTTPSWATASATSSGALILAGYSTLGGFGKFCGVIVALGVIANNIPGTYSAALNFQMLSPYMERIPRYLWTCLCVVIYTACALGGRNHLYTIFQNFLPLMGYWVAIFLIIVLEEHVFFLLILRSRTLDWSIWADPRQLPVGVAALTAFLIGWAGAIVGMDQVYYVGPLAKLVGDNGADMGVWLGVGFTALSFPLLRCLELRFLGR